MTISHHNHTRFAPVYCRECHELVCCAERHPDGTNCMEVCGDICERVSTNYPCEHVAGNYVQTNSGAVL